MRWLVIAVVVATARPAEPCAPAPPPGTHVAVTDEQAVIIWDAAHHVEHFIRKAGFESDAKEFGFLVPTPAKPELGEVPDTIFDAFATAIEPKVRYESSGVTVGCALSAGDKSAPVATAAPVRVLQTVHVAGYNATTLAADDAGALAAWLANHGFADTPALDEWLRGYVVDHWTITAFVVAGDPRQPIATAAVDMKFTTDRPFYPYREPATTPATAARTLWVYMVADKRYAATLAQQPWTATVKFAAPLALPAELSKLAGDAKFVTAFDDTGPRHGTDEVYFAPSSDGDVLPTDIVIKEPAVIPLEGVVGAILLAGVLWLVVGRRRRR